MKTIPYALLPFERNKCGKVFMMVVIEPGASRLQSFTVAVGLNVKRGKTTKEPIQRNGLGGYYNTGIEKSDADSFRFNSP
jgi:hypothetical protein